MKRASLLAMLFLSVVSLLAPSSAAQPALQYPNLVPLAPEELFLFGTNIIFGQPTVTVDGCLLDEKARRDPGRCLRFDTSVANLGVGPLEVIYRIEPSGETWAYQRIYGADGSSESSKVTRSEFHPTHAHFHIEDFYVARLWAAKLSGRPTGPEPLAVSTKNGFCPEDTSTVSGQEGSESYNCAYPPNTDFEESTPGTIVGISAGWMDTYGAILPDQYIDIEGVADGNYVLQITIDPNNVFRESSEIDNSVCTLIELVSESVTAKMEVPCGRRRSQLTG